MQYLQKEVRSKSIFCADDHHSFLKIVIIFHAYSTQHNKYAVSLQYLKKELSYEVDGLHADKHESLLQVHNITFNGFG